MTIAADLCVYTNHNFIIEILDTNENKVETTTSNTTTNPPKIEEITDEEETKKEQVQASN